MHPVGDIHKTSNFILSLSLMFNTLAYIFYLVSRHENLWASEFSLNEKLKRKNTNLEIN